MGTAVSILATPPRCSRRWVTWHLDPGGPAVRAPAAVPGVRLLKPGDQGGPPAGRGAEARGAGRHGGPLCPPEPVPGRRAHARAEGAPRHAVPRVRGDLLLPRASPSTGRGALSLPRGSVDLQRLLELWRPLGPPAPGSRPPPGSSCCGGAEALSCCLLPEQTAELGFSLSRVPGSGRLTVVALEARGPRPVLADPYVKVQPMLNQRKWKKRKTSARKGTAAPYFNQAFTFLVPFSQIQGVDLVLPWAEPVGKVLLGSRASGQPLQHWADMLAQRPGGPSPSGAACSRPGRWTGPWPCSPTGVCPCPASEAVPGPGSPCGLPRVPL